MSVENQKFYDLLREIKQDWRTNGRDTTRPGFRALAMYRIGRWQLGLQHKTIFGRLKKRIFARIYLALHRHVRNVYGIELHASSTVGRDVRIAHQGGIVIHEFAIIGDNCLIRQNVTIGSAGRAVVADEAPVLEAGVELGSGSAILGRVTIGENARIGSNVVVYTNVPAGASLVAQPARMFKAPKTLSQPDKKENESLQAEQTEGKE